MSDSGFHLTASAGPLGRRGVLSTAHGELSTPFFMPIATRAAVKTLSSADVERLGSPILLSNTFHLMLRPGMEVMERVGGLHAFMSWNGAILTDSGGFQVFSLADRKTITEEGVLFRSPIDGAKLAMTPELSMQIQRTLGSDIVMCFDDVIGLPAERAEVEDAMERSLRWARRCRDEFEKGRGQGERAEGVQLFGIIQGGTDIELRKRSVKGMLDIGFDGYAIGGLSVGEPFEDAIKVIDEILPMLPEDKPRYFMGGAQPDQIVEYVKRGIDMFDCVLPTRNARHGHLYRWGEGVGSRESGVGKYEVVNVTNAKWRGSGEPIRAKGREQRAEGEEEWADVGFSEELSRYSMGYLHHLFDTKEMLAYRLATIANLTFYLDLLDRKSVV